MDFWFFFWCEKSFQTQIRATRPELFFRGSDIKFEKMSQGFWSGHFCNPHSAWFSKIKSKIIIFKNIFDLTILLPNEMTRLLYFSWNLKKMHFFHNFMRNSSGYDNPIILSGSKGSDQLASPKCYLPIISITIPKYLSLNSK